MRRWLGTGLVAVLALAAGGCWAPELGLPGMPGGEGPTPTDVQVPPQDTPPEDVPPKDVPPDAGTAPRCPEPRAGSVTPAPVDLTGVLAAADGTAPTERSCASAKPGQLCTADCLCLQGPGPLPTWLTGVWAEAPSQVWMVGEGPLLRWDGARFSRVRGLRGRFHAVAGTGPGDGWAVGVGGAIARWDGVAWRRVPSGTTRTLKSVWASGPADAWAVGDDVVLRWDGTRWAQVPLPFTLRFWLERVSGTGPDDVWLTDWNYGGALHWDGRAWSWHRLQPAGDGTGVGWVLAAPGGALVPVEGRVRRWSGAAWEDVSGPWGSGSASTVGTVAGAPWLRAGESLYRPVDGGGWASLPAPAGLAALDGRADDAAWAVGAPGQLHRWDGARWQTLAAGAREPAVASHVWGFGPDAAWAAGYGHVRRWDGARWSVLPLASAQDHVDHVWGSGPTDVWFAGTALDARGYPRPLLLRWDGAWLLEAPRPSGLAGVHGLTGTGPADVWATTTTVGKAGAQLQRWDGTAWAEVALPEAVRRHGPRVLWAEAPGRLWMVSGGPELGVPTTLHRWDGHTWTLVPGMPTDEGVRVLWGSGPCDVWALTRHRVLRFDGTAWRVALSAGGDGTDGGFSTLFGAGPDAVWVQRHYPNGRHPLVLHWDGLRWDVQDGFNPYGLRAMGGAGGAAWAMDNLGNLLRHQP